MFRSQRLEFQDRQEYHAFCEATPLASIHQSWQWGDFQIKIPGRDKFWVVVVKAKTKIILAALVLRTQLPRGKSWLLIPRGPIGDLHNQAAMNSLLKEIQKLAEEENAIFMRCEFPLLKINSADTDSLGDIKDDLESPDHASFQKYLSANGFRKAHQYNFPEFSRVILLEEETGILKQMKSKGRYNIKLAAKKGVKVTSYSSDNGEKLAPAVKDFFRLVRTTTARNHFSGHGEQFYLDLLKTVDSKLYLAWFEDKCVAGIIVTFHQKIAIYYYGASANQYRNLMAPYLLQWEAMKEAKSYGCKYYDLFGTAPSTIPNHPWQNITQFKNKFGGFEVQYLAAQEKVFDRKWFIIFRVIKSAVRLVRKLKTLFRRNQ